MKTVFIDIDTQLDFLFPAGALYAPGAERIAPTLAALNHFAKQRSIALVSTMDTHSEDDPEFRVWKPHCVRGTHGWQKYQPTLVGQPLFEKNCIDFFDEELVRVLQSTHAERYVVYGLVTEYCVGSVLFGLLGQKAHVELVTDAVHSLSAAAGQDVQARFTAGGGRLISSATLLSA